MFRQGLSTPGVKKGACRFDKTWEVKKKNPCGSWNYRCIQLYPGFLLNDRWF